MEYQKIAIFLNDESNKPSKIRTRNWFEIYDDIRGGYFDDYSDAHILVKGNISVNNIADAGASVINANKKSNI